MAKSTPITVPSLAEACPDYAALVEKRNDLLAQRSSLSIEKDRVWTAGKGARVPAAGKTARIAALLGDEPDETPDLAARWAECKRQIADLDLALAELDKRMRTARGPASAKACAAVEDGFRATAAKLARSLLDVHAQHTEMVRLIEDLTDADVAWTGYLPNVSATTLLGHPKDKSGRLAYWLRSAAEAGAIKATDIPEVLR